MNGVYTHIYSLFRDILSIATGGGGHVSDDRKLVLGNLRIALRVGDYSA